MKGIYRSKSQNSSGPSVLVALFVAYVAAPVRDLPVVGLSYSIVVFAFIMLGTSPSKYFTVDGIRDRWTLNGVAIWVGVLASAVAGLGREWSLNIQVTTTLKFVFGYAYWIAVLIVLSHLVFRFNLQWTVLTAAALAISGLSAIVIGEYLTNRPYAWTQMTQNIIGIQLSTFGVTPLGLFLYRVGWRRWIGACGFTIVTVASLVNASRSSWLALGASACVLIVLDAVSMRRIRSLAWAGIFAGVVFGAWGLLPRPATQKFEERSITLRNLNTDQSFQSRIALTRKALKIFSQNPWFGIGPGSFYYYAVDLELDRSLRSKEKKLNTIGAHNAYGQLLAEGGVAVGLPFIVLLLRLGIGGCRSSVVLARGGHMWGIINLAMLTGVSTHLWTLAGLGSTGPWLVYSLVLVSIYTVKQMSEQPKGRSPTMRRISCPRVS